MGAGERTSIELTGTGLTPADVLAVARGDAAVTLAAEAREAMARSAAVATCASAGVVVGPAEARRAR
jgi:histidine ammonia-lyase